jgi:predicted permease
MSQVATVILPFFGLIAFGFGAGRWLRITHQSAAALNIFVFYFAMPALFFQLVAETPFRDLANWSFVLTTTFATYCVFAIAFSFGALITRGNIPQATIEGLIGSYANVGYMAPGLTLAAFGTAAAAPTALVFAFDSAMLFALLPLMMALGGTERVDPVAMGRMVARRILLHPFIIAAALGFVAAVVGFAPPGPLDALLTTLRSAAVPCALFGVGLSLSFRKVEPVTLDLPVLIAIKLLLHPLIVYLLLSWIAGFDPVWVYSAVLMAALPPAANVHVFAQQYQTLAAKASMAILVGTAVSVLTITVILALVLQSAVPIDPFS